MRLRRVVGRRDVVRRPERAVDVLLDVVDERVAVVPMPMPSPSHRATATRVHFAPTTEESNNS